MAAIAIPAGAVTYKGLLNALPSILRTPSPNGEPDRFVPFGVDWGTDGGPANAILIDLSSGGVQPIGQIAAMYIDNSGSNADVQVIFVSSQSRYTIPGQTSGYIPVSTGDIRFYLVAPTAGSGDQTFGAMYNFVPPPVFVAESEFASVATGGGVIQLTSTPTSTQLVPAGQNGIVTGVEIYIDGLTPGAANGTIQWQLVGGAPSTLLVAQGEVFARTAVNTDNLPVFSMSGMAVPFRNGLAMSINITGTLPTAGRMTVNVYHR